MKNVGHVALLVLLYLLVSLNVVYPVVRFTVAPANYAAFAVAQFIPIKTLLLLRFQTGWPRWLTLVAATLLMVAAVPLGLGAAGCAVLSMTGNESFERQQTTSTGFGDVTTYRTNGGAATGFGMLVRQECRVVPGLLVVRDLAGEYPADEARLQLQTRGSVHIVFVDNSERPPTQIDHIVHLRRFLLGQCRLTSACSRQRPSRC